MKYGIQYEQGDILIAPFPFSDLSSTKQRPIFVLSKKSYNLNTEDIITCGITSNIKDKSCSVIIGNKDLSAGSIPLTSRIKVDKIFTINKKIIKKKIGKINEETIKKVKQELFKLI